METKTITDTISAGEIISTAQLEIPVETELLLADYLPQVHKVVKCFAHAVILQKQVSAGRITLEGYLRCEVYYQAEEDAALCQTEQKLPFTKHWELKDDCAYVTCISVYGMPAYLNALAVSSSRISLRGAYTLHVQAQGGTDTEVLTGIDNPEYETKAIPVRSATLCAQQEKVITAEIPLGFSSAPKAVLSVQSACPESELQIIDNRVVVKGKIATEVLYTTENGQLQQLQSDVPFNEVVSFEKLLETDKCAVDIRPFGCTVQSQEADAGTTYSVTVSAALTVDVYREKELQVLADAFSVTHTTQTQRQNAVCESLHSVPQQQCVCSISDTLPPQAENLLCAFSLAMPPEIVNTVGQATLCGKVTVYAFCRNDQGEIDCYEKISDYALPSPLQSEDALLRRASVAVLHTQAEKRGDALQAEVTLQITGTVLMRTVADVLSAVQEGEALAAAAPDVAMYIYYAKENEDFFDVAKRYNTRPDSIVPTVAQDGIMPLLMLPAMGNTAAAQRAKDELPQSASGRTIMTTEPTGNHGKNH